MVNHLTDLSSSRHRTTLKWVLAAIMVAIITFVTIVVGNSMQQSESDTDIQPIITITTAPVVPMPSVTPDEQPSGGVVTPVPVIEKLIPLRSAPTRVVVPDARIDMRVLPLPKSSIIATGGDEGVTLVPPETPDAYLTDRYTQAGADAEDLAMIIAHACKELAICDQIDWQFNRLSDRTLVKKGTELFVETSNGKVCYSVDTDPVTYPKETFHNQVAVFGSVPQPGRLVLVSCYTGDIHQQRVAVVASMHPCDT